MVKRMNDMEMMGAVLNGNAAILRGDEVDRLNPLWRKEGVLKPSRRLDHLPCGCGYPHDGDVEEEINATTGEVRLFMRCAETGELYRLKEEDVIGWEFDGRSMADVLRRALPCRGSVSEMIPGLLWYAGSCDTAIGGRRRDIYFALGVNSEERAGRVYGALPRASTSLLFVGAGIIRTDGFEADRVFRLQDVLGICDRCWRVDLARLEERLPGTGSTAPRTVHAVVRGGENLARITEELGRWIRAEYDRYASNRRMGREYRLHAPTMTALAQAIGVNKSTVSDILSEKMHGRDPRYMAVRELWATAHDMDRIVRRLHHYAGPGPHRMP